MTALLHRRGEPGVGWVVAIAFCCAMFGLAAGVKPEYALFGLLGIGFVVAVFADLPLGLAVFSALSFLDELGAGGPALSFNKVAGLLLILSWALRRGTTARDDARTVIGEHPRLFTWIVALLGWSTISAMWAVQPGVALTYVYRDLLQLLLIPIVYSAVNSRRDVYLIVSGFLIGAIVSAVYGLAHPVSTSSAYAGRLVGTTGDPNQQAAVLVAAVALAAGLGAVALRSRRLRLLATLAGVLSLIGIVQTLSRSGLVSLGFVLICGVIFGGLWRRKAAILLLLALIGVGGYFVFVAPPQATHRVTDANSDGRNDIWKVGWRMFESNPVLGVGAGNFQQASNRYLERPGLVTAAAFIIVTPKVAHNIYLEQLATLGVPGFILMCAVFIGGIAAALRAAHIFERLGDRELDLVSRSCILGLFAFLASDFFISGLQTKQFWVIFSLGLAMLKLAQTQQRLTYR